MARMGSRVANRENKNLTDLVGGFYRKYVAIPPGVSASDFGTIQRDDGKPRTTFRGYPLYYWAGDEKPGDTKGQNVNNIWFVIDPGNFPVK